MTRLSNKQELRDHLRITSFLLPWLASQVTLVVKNLPANAGDLRHVGLIPGLGRFPGEEHGNPLQYFCLENPMDRGAWWATVHGVTKSQTQLKWLSTLTRKQPKCLSTEEWIKRIWCTYTINYYLAPKKNEVMPFATTWMDPEIIILRWSKSEKTNTIWDHLICGI